MPPPYSDTETAQVLGTLMIFQLRITDEFFIISGLPSSGREGMPATWPPAAVWLVAEDARRSTALQKDGASSLVWPGATGSPYCSGTRRWATVVAPPVEERSCSSIGIVSTLRDNQNLEFGGILSNRPET